MAATKSTDIPPGCELHQRHRVPCGIVERASRIGPIGAWGLQYDFGMSAHDAYLRYTFE